MQGKALYLTVFIALIGLSYCQFLNQDGFKFGDQPILIPDICDVQIALNLKYLQLEISGQQIEGDNGQKFARINFDFKVKQPSDLTKNCISKSVKDIFYVDAQNQQGPFNDQQKVFNDQGLYIQLPLSEIQQYATATSTISNKDKTGFSSALNLKITFGNTRVPVREYQIQYIIEQLANNSILFKDLNVTFKNSSAGVRLI